MSRKVAVYVHVAGRVFTPGDEVPDDLVERIRNPAVWAEEAPAPEPVSPAVWTQPPRAGQGSSKEAWARFAAGHGVELENDAGRDDYVAELERRGVIEPKE